MHRDFNRAIAQTTNIHAHFENPVNLQSKYTPHLRCVFAVA